MDTQTVTLLQILGSAVGGGGLFALIKKLFSSNQVKELSDIIKTMGERIDEQDVKISELSKKVDESDSARIELSDELNRYKFAHTFMGLCSAKETCPIAMALNKK